MTESKEQNIQEKQANGQPKYCPWCDSGMVKMGKNRGKQRWVCKTCGRATIFPLYTPITGTETKIKDIFSRTLFNERRQPNPNRRYGLAVIDEQAELPTANLSDTNITYNNIYRLAQDDMIKAGWRKVI